MHCIKVAQPKISLFFASAYAIGGVIILIDVMFCILLVPDHVTDARHIQPIRIPSIKVTTWHKSVRHEFDATAFHGKKAAKANAAP